MSALNTSGRVYVKWWRLPKDIQLWLFEKVGWKQGGEYPINIELMPNSPTHLELLEKIKQSKLKHS